MLPLSSRMLNTDDPNTQKQLKRSEQIKRYNERENAENSNLEKIGNSRPSKVRFPKGCVFLAACSSGDIDEVKAHLKLGVNINTTNIDGLTALHQACIDANLDMVKFLVENGADINAQDNEGWTPLHAAVSVGNLDVAKLLVSKGARLNVCNNDSDLPVDLCDSGNTQMREFLDEEIKRQSIDTEFERKKEELIMYEDAKNMSYENKVHGKTGATALHVSAAKGYTEVMLILLQHGVNVNAVDKDGWTPLHAAAHWEQEEVCRILAEHGASFEIRNYSKQTPYDVCDSEMGAKLKQIELSTKQTATQLSQKEKLADLASLNNQCKLEASRNRRSSITRLTNEAKSSLSDRDKKQDKILLSPITTAPPPATTTATSTPVTNTSSTNNKPQFDIFSNSDSDNDKQKTNESDLVKPVFADNDADNQKENEDHLSFDKENLNRNTSSSNNGSSNNLTTITQNNNTNNNQDSLNNNKQHLYTKTNNVNRTKSGLQESLKSLSAHVRMMDEDDTNEKSIRFNNLISDNENATTITTTTSPTIITSSQPTTILPSQLMSQSNCTVTPSPLKHLNIGKISYQTFINNPSSNTRSPSPPPLSINSSLNNKINTFNGKTQNFLEKRWGPSDSSSIYKRRITTNPAQTNGESKSPTPSAPTTPPPLPNHHETNGTSNNKQTTNGNNTPDSNQTSQSPQTTNQTSSNESLSRRYSSAPLASKDEQAELIRKQKAKLERHFRRSTTAVSYEDIKSAEATIKGTSNSASNTSLSQQSSIVDTPTTPNDSFNLTLSPSSNPASIGVFSTPSNPNSATIHGVSSLSSIFGESIKQQQTQSLPLSITTNNATIPPAGAQRQTSLTLSNQTESNSEPAPAPSSSSSTPSSSTPQNNNNTANVDQSDKDTIIANDIETDKLLNVIEKSKGFSDVKSTTAVRRQRNRLAHLANLDRNSNIFEDGLSGTANGKKINKLIWNQDRLEVEYRDKEEELKAAGLNTESPLSESVSSTPNNSSSTLNQMSRQSVNSSPNNPLRRQNSGNSLESKSSMNQQQVVVESVSREGSAQPTSHTGRQMYRFGQNDSTSAYVTNGSANGLSSNSNFYTGSSLSSRSGIKRSVSQVPSTDRRPLAGSTNGSSSTTTTTTTTANTTTINAANFTSSPTSNETNNDSKNIDYKLAYELTKKENESLNQTVHKLQKELDDQSKEKRAFDRRISELEEELKKIENLKQDNNRLKEENAALIRVISKLSK